MALLRRSTGKSTVPPPGRPSIEATPMIDASARQRIVVVGQVTHMRSRPITGVPALAVTVSDGTASVVAVWTGRRALGGVTLGRRLALEGVAVRHGNMLEFTNPVYTLLPAAEHT